MVRCANCNRENPEDVALCVYCGELVDPSGFLRQRDTRQLNDHEGGERKPRWGTARFDPKKRLILRVIGSIQTLKVDPHQPGGVSLGRRDPETNNTPTVDLTAFDAQELGVSRQHARLEVEGETLRIVDLGSANCTYVNGLRLIPLQPHTLRDGDEIRLGHLKLQCFFVEVSD